MNKQKIQMVINPSKYKDNKIDNMMKRKQLSKLEQELLQELRDNKEIQCANFILSQMTKRFSCFRAIEWNTHCGHLKVIFVGHNATEGYRLKACVFLCRMLSFLNGAIERRCITCSKVTWNKNERSLFDSEKFQGSKSHYKSVNDKSRCYFEGTYMYIPNFELPKFIKEHAMGMVRVK